MKNSITIIGENGNTEIDDLSLNPALPYVEQLANYYRYQITSGKLQLGDELPPVKNFGGVSHVTVMKAYHKLADEGFIHLQRAKKTRVAVDIANQHYVILTHYREHTLYEDYLMSEFQQVAMYKNRKPEVFYFNSEKMNTCEEVDAIIPNQLQQLIKEGQVRGVILHKPEHMLGIIDWLQNKTIPHVSLSSTETLSQKCAFVSSDHAMDYENGIKFLASKKCRSICILPWHWKNKPPVITRLQKDFPGVKWIMPKEFNFDKNDDIESGRRFVAHCCKSKGSAPDALVILDNITALGALFELKERGFRIPEDIQLLISSFDCQILPIFKGCVLVSTPIKKYIEAAIDLMEEIISKKASSETVAFVENTICSL